MQPYNSDNVDRLLSVLNQLDNIKFNPDKKGLYYDSDKNKISTFQSRWFINFFKERSENSSTAETMRQVNQLFDASVRDIKLALLNPALSEQERDLIFKQAGQIENKVKDYNNFAGVKELAKQTNSKNVAQAINTLITKSKAVPKMVESTTNAVRNVNKALSSLANLKDSPAGQIAYNKIKGQFFVSENRVSETNIKEQIRNSLDKLDADIKQLQEHVINNLSPFKNLKIRTDMNSVATLKELQKQKETLNFKDTDFEKVLENITEYQGQLKEIIHTLPDATVGFNHLLSRLNTADKEIYQKQFHNVSRNLINKREEVVQILNKFKEIASEKHRNPNHQELENSEEDLALDNAFYDDLDDIINQSSDIQANPDQPLAYNDELAASLNQPLVNPTYDDIDDILNQSPDIRTYPEAEGQTLDAPLSQFPEVASEPRVEKQQNQPSSSSPTETPPARARGKEAMNKKLEFTKRNIQRQQSVSSSSIPEPEQEGQTFTPKLKGSPDGQTLREKLAKEEAEKLRKLNEPEDYMNTLDSLLSNNPSPQNGTDSEDTSGTSTPRSDEDENRA